MELYFEYVRIGKISENKMTEKLLKEDCYELKTRLSSYFEINKFEYPYENLPLLIVIPKSGLKVKLSLSDINCDVITNSLKSEFYDSIYKGKSSVLSDNSANDIFKRELNQNFKTQS